MSTCPCGSGRQYEQCCGRYHQGIRPEDALALMRSRYSAYARNLAAYIISTTHPRNPRAMADELAWATEILAFSTTTQFERLEIHEFTDGQETAYVQFTAYLSQGEMDASFTERSRFVKLNGRWFYRDGSIKPRKK